MSGQEHAVGDVQARIAEDLPGRRLVQGEEGTGGVDFLFQPNFDKPVYYVGAVAMKAAAE